MLSYKAQCHGWLLCQTEGWWIINIKYGLLEIKCPFTLWNLTPEKACSDPRFYCHINGKPELKRVPLFQAHLGRAGLKWCCLQYSFKKRMVTFHLIFSSFLPFTFSAKISDSSSEISASDSCKLCRSASFGSTHTSLLWCLPYLVSLESDSCSTLSYFGS